MVFIRFWCVLGAVSLVFLLNTIGSSGWVFLVFVERCYMVYGFVNSPVVFEGFMVFIPCLFVLFSSRFFVPCPGFPCMFSIVFPCRFFIGFLGFA